MYKKSYASAVILQTLSQITKAWSLCLVIVTTNFLLLTDLHALEIQDPTDSNDNYQPHAVGSDYAATASNNHEAFIVTDFRIVGLQKISKEAVIQELPVKLGQPITAADSSEIIKTLYKTGFFQKIELSRDGHILVLKLTERPSIGKLELTGIKNKAEVTKILKEAQIETGRFYDPTKLAQVEQEIERHYLMKGNYGVKVNSIVTEEERNRIALTIDIYEGDAARIKHIEIVGNKVFTDKQLQKNFLHTPTKWNSWFTKSDRYAKEKLAADLEKLRSHYLDRGYVNFQVNSTQVSLSTDKKDVYITINVAEGEQYNFADPIKLDGNFVVPQKKLRTIIDEKLKPHTVFSRQALWETKEALETALGEEGYGQAQARLNIENDDQNKLIKVEFYIEPGKRITVRRIEIVGNNLTQDIVLRRGLEQMEGAWISTKSVKEGKEYMSREGFADQIEVTNKPVLGKDDQVDINYKVEEQRTAQFSLSLAYSAADRFMYSVAADFRNFLGTGKNTNFTFENSKTTTLYNFGYYDPYYTSDGIGMGYNLHYQNVNLSRTSNIFEYSTDTYGGDVNWSYPLSMHNKVVYSLAADSIGLKFDENSASTPREVRVFTINHGKNFKDYSAAMALKHNSLDAYIFPTKGLTQRGAFKISLPVADLKYYQLEYDVSYFQPITTGYILQLSSELGYKANYKRNQYFPFFKHYYVGGADTVRGYEERSLGPLDSTGQPFGGNILAVARASLIFPTPFVPDIKSVRTSLFFDAGQVYDTNYKNSYDPAAAAPGVGKSSRDPQGLRYAVGVSLMWHMPLGVPMVFSLAKPLNPKETDKTESFTFSFSTNF